MNSETPIQEKEKKMNLGGNYVCHICGMIIDKDVLTYWRNKNVYCGPICSMKDYNQNYKEPSQ